MGSSFQAQQQDPGALARGYTRSVRRLEVASIATFFVLMTLLAWRLWPHAQHSPWLALAAFTFGYLAADLISGMVHWLADTWGRTDMPLVGKYLLRPFREHHVDPQAITRHDFVETNGNNCMMCVVPVGSLFALDQGPEHSFNLFFSVFIGSCALWVFGTNQFHKWAHAPKPAAWVAWLQKMYLILPPEHHAIHHTAPYNKYYCITVGWLNRPLTAIRFFSTLELWVTWCCGALPRSDDIGERAALAADRR